ncbi:porin [Paraburkholderia tropica]|uniref:porin n=1 Tax=Paraburkholderia tropica TaxID=92647 RepID=UPI003D2A7E78
MKQNKLSIAALAVSAMVANVAHAQSSVTLYGILDAGFLYTSKTINSTGGNAGHQVAFLDGGWAPSLFGLKGTEDLGGGLKANFLLESGINTSNGALGNSNGGIFGRQAWVGLGNKYGDLKMGLQFSPFFLSVFDLDPRGFSQLGSSLPIYFANAWGTGVFNPNAISFSSASFGGFSGRAMYALGGVAGNFQSGREYSLSGKYENGSLVVETAFYSGKAGGNANTAIPTTTDFEGRLLGASYKVDSLKVAAIWSSFKTRGAILSGSNDTSMYNVGADYMVKPYLDVNAGVWFLDDRQNSKSHAVMGALGAQYLLSKRTAVYGQVAVVNNKGDFHQGVSLNLATTAPTGTTTGVNVGIRHLF